MFTPVFQNRLESAKLPWALVSLDDLDNPLWETFDVKVVPTVMVFKEGKPVFRRDGVLGRGLPKEAITEVIHELEQTRLLPTK